MNALTRNIALLIDADNAQSAAIDPVLTVLAELGTVNVRRAYGNWSKPGLKGWRDVMVKHGIEPQQQFDLTKGKNATDMKMTIDAMDLLFRGRIDGFGIMSSDSDFMPLATAHPAGRLSGLWIRQFAYARGVQTGVQSLHRCRCADQRSAPANAVQTDHRRCATRRFAAARH
ncbi:NYN domain [Sphingomonas paucimobilis]|nr:NYN domain [Sphingomonas paucimobilis]